MHQANRYRVAEGELRPFVLRRRDMLRLLKAPKLLQRMIATLSDPDEGKRWLATVRKGGPGRELLVTTASFEDACDRMQRGESPPLLPSELRAAERKGCSDE